MAELPADPNGAELEDLVAAHFAARGCFVEQGVTAREQGDILELDVIWTDYRRSEATAHPVEVKSGSWGLTDLFKFYGWTTYLEMLPGQFVYTQPPSDEEKILHVAAKTGIALIDAGDQDALSNQLSQLELPAPAAEYSPVLWRYSYWIQRRFFTSLQQSIRQQSCPITAIAAKKYYRLINDALFFEPDPRKRFAQLLSAHSVHPRLAKSAAAEIAGLDVDLKDPPNTTEFSNALYRGSHPPVQACFYLAHRARLFVLKAAVDYALAKGRGELEPEEFVIRLGDRRIVLDEPSLTASFKEAIADFSQHEWFPLLPTFWQTFLWTWGGFILRDRADTEYRALSVATGIPVGDIGKALSAFDRFFPTETSWLARQSNTSMDLVKMMPAPLRGLGAFHRSRLYGIEDYGELGYSDYTGVDMARDHNCGAQLMDCPDHKLGR